VNSYRDYRVRLRLRSPLGTPMLADTLFGHLAWEVARREGPEGVSTFLEPFLAGEPPFVLSDAFPEGLLPRPMLPTGRIPGDAESREAYARIKQVAKAPFLSVPDFLEVVTDPSRAPEPVPSPWRTVKTPRASIDRGTWTTTPGGRFFETESLALAAGEAATGDGSRGLDVYLRAREGWEERALTLLRWVAKTGFGRDRSVGLGEFVVEGLEPLGDLFTGVAGADGFVSLSSWVPAAGDPVEGRWRARVKRGFLGEAAGGGNPFKRPLVQLEPGSAMRTGSPPRPCYGRMVRHIAPGMPEAAQYGFALAVPCRWR